MEAACYWCGDIAKMKESTDFSDRMDMKIFMCANYTHDTPESSSLWIRPPVRFKLDQMTYWLCYCLMTFSVTPLPMISLDRCGATGSDIA
jgi:hypothetical protein